MSTIMTDDGVNHTSMAAIPMTQRKVKTLLIEKQNADEARAIKSLASEITEASMAGTIHREWGLNRKAIKKCHKATAGDRTLQVTFSSLVGGDRFETLQGSELARTRCPNRARGKLDSWGRFKKGMGQKCRGTCK